MTLEERADIITSWMQKAIDIGKADTDCEYTSAGMAYHLMRDAELLELEE